MCYAASICPRGFEAMFGGSGGAPVGGSAGGRVLWYQYRDSIPWGEGYVEEGLAVVQGEWSVCGLGTWNDRRHREPKSVLSELERIASFCYRPSSGHLQPGTQQPGTQASSTV